MVVVFGEGGVFCYHDIVHLCQEEFAFLQLLNINFFFK